MESDPNTNGKLGFGRAQFCTAERQEGRANLMAPVAGEGAELGRRRWPAQSSCAHAAGVGAMEEDDPQPDGPEAFLQ